MAPKVLVTGSEGYIGAVLVPLLVKNGYTVRGIDACFYGASGNTDYELFRKDIRLVNKKDLVGFDAIIHLAALSNDPMGALDAALTKEINFEASAQLAKHAKAAGVSRILFSSSCSIYGKTENGTVDESSPVAPLTEYARSKVATENALQALADTSFTVGLLRNSTVYGYSPQFRDDLVVNNFVTTALNSGEIRVKSDGTPWRPLIDVRDLSQIFMEFLTVPSERINGEIINVGFDENNFQVREVLEIVQKALPKCRVVYTGEHGADTRSYRVSFAKIHRLFPSVRRRWPMYESVVDMVEKLQSGLAKNQHAFTRLTALTALLRSKEIDSHLFRVQ